VVKELYRDSFSPKAELQDIQELRWKTMLETNLVYIYVNFSFLIVYYRS